MPRSFSAASMRRPGASLFNVPRLPEKELKEDAVDGNIMSVDNIEELQAWVDGLLDERDGSESEDSPTPPPSGATTSAPTLKAPGQQAAASPNLSVLQSAWNSALSGIRATQPMDGVKPACTLNGPGVAVAEGAAMPMSDSPPSLGEAALLVSATDLKIVQVPTGCYFAYPGRALQGYAMYSIVPPAQHAHVQHQLQVLLRMEQILRISGLGGHGAEPPQHRVYHHVIVPSSNLGQPPIAIAMESLFTLFLASDDQAPSILVQSRPCVD